MSCEPERGEGRPSPSVPPSRTPSPQPVYVRFEKLDGRQGRIDTSGFLKVGATRPPYLPAPKVASGAEGIPVFEGRWDPYKHVWLCLNPDGRWVLVYVAHDASEAANGPAAIEVSEEYAIVFRSDNDYPLTADEAARLEDLECDPCADSRVKAFYDQVQQARAVAVPVVGAEAQACSEGDSAGDTAASSSEAPSPSLLILGGPNERPIVGGKKKDPLPPAQYRVLKALVEAHARGERLSQDALRNRTKDEQGNTVDDPVGALERLCKRDPDWVAVIDMAVVPGRGYGLKGDPPTPTQKS